jgi:hypothetical protein
MHFFSACIFFGVASIQLFRVFYLVWSCFDRLKLISFRRNGFFDWRNFSLLFSRGGVGGIRRTDLGLVRRRRLVLS